MEGKRPWADSHEQRTRQGWASGLYLPSSDALVERTSALVPVLAPSPSMYASFCRQDEPRRAIKSVREQDGVFPQIMTPQREGGRQRETEIQRERERERDRQTDRAQASNFAGRVVHLGILFYTPEEVQVEFLALSQEFSLDDDAFATVVLGSVELIALPGGLHRPTLRNRGQGPTSS